MSAAVQHGSRTPQFGVEVGHLGQWMMGLAMRTDRHASIGQLLQLLPGDHVPLCIGQRVVQLRQQRLHLLRR